MLVISTCAPYVRLSLKTNDLALARRKRDKLETADDSLWTSYMVDGKNDPARRWYYAAVKRVEAMDLTSRLGVEFEREKTNVVDAT